jgi:uncharacterized membrane protein
MRFLREWIAIMALTAETAIVWQSWGSLPLHVPTHFAVDGRPDAYGPKASILVLPIVSLVLYVVLTALSFFPQRLNYPVQVTEANRAPLQKIALSMLGWLKALVMCIFAFIVQVEVHSATATVSGLGWGFLPVVLGALALIIGIGVVRMRRVAL